MIETHHVTLTVRLVSNDGKQDKVLYYLRTDDFDPNKKRQKLAVLGKRISRKMYELAFWKLKNDVPTYEDNLEKYDITTRLSGHLADDIYRLIMFNSSITNN